MGVSILIKTRKHDKILVCRFHVYYGKTYENRVIGISGVVIILEKTYENEEIEIFGGSENLLKSAESIECAIFGGMSKKIEYPRKSRKVCFRMN